MVSPRGPGTCSYPLLLFFSFVCVKQIVLKFSACNRDDALNDHDLRFLCEALLQNATIHTIVLMNTNIDVRRCKDRVLALLEENRFITTLYFGERPEHKLPQEVVDKLKENQRLHQMGIVGPLSLTTQHPGAAGQHHPHHPHP